MNYPASVIGCLPEAVRSRAKAILKCKRDQLNEIRLRVGFPTVAMYSSGYEYIEKEYILSSECIQEVFERLCEYAVYSHQQELSQGFITLEGGHRAGICGTASLDKNGNRTIRYISSINIRIANEHIGCSDELFTNLFSKKISSTLIVGPPCSGKTTLLKDIALKLSSPPYSRKVCVVDERNEIAAMHHGAPQNTMGEFCDVLCGYPKAEGILIAVRTLSPEIVICDEIGGWEEVEAISRVLHSGIIIIATAHACNADELYSNYSIRKILKSGAFANVVILKGGSSRGEAESIIEVV